MTTLFSTTNNGPVKTPIAAQFIGVPVSHLYSLLRRGAISAPGKDSSGDYAWFRQDIDAAQIVLGNRRNQTGQTLGV